MKNDKTFVNPSVTSMDQYAPYVDALEELTVKVILSSPTGICSSEIELALDGQPMQALRERVPISTLKNSGAFFTHHTLSDKLIEPIIADIKEGIPVKDPACGTGNLLLACARHLPIMSDINDTVTAWGNQLYGHDIHPEFIRATKIRLLLLAIERGAKGPIPDTDISEFFPHIQESDYLVDPSLSKVNCIVVNPPYSIVQAPAQCSWASGIISNASLFMEKCVTTSDPNTKIVALLPDVLRTGSRYSKWREMISKHAIIESIKIIGQFDKLTDIDVFLLRMTAMALPNKKTNDHWWNLNEKAALPKKVVKDYFNVNVGPVVPHRDPDKGTWYPFIHAKILTPWDTVNIDTKFKKKRYPVTTFKPPFMVVRRTSRPGDKYRATGTIITGKKRVYVENHLIVIKPISGKVSDCKQLLSYLKSDAVNKWLDKRIRCRHLTVGAVKNIPWIKS